MEFKAAGVLLVFSFILSACNVSNGAVSNASDPGVTSPDGHRSPSPASPVALVFNGTGTSASDEQALVAILQTHSIAFQEVTSPQLEAMTASQMAQYKLIVWPGGDSTIQSNNLDANTRERVRQAVVSSGVNFAGFCAGAFIAVGPAPAVGGTPWWGLSIANDDYVTEYLPNGTGNAQPIAAMVPISFPNGTSRDLVWWDGPFLPSIPSGVVSKYPNGTAAMVELQSGNGFVVLTGVHPEAPESWRTEESLVDTDGLDTDIAWSLINSALTRTRLQTY